MSSRHSVLLALLLLVSNPLSLLGNFIPLFLLFPTPALGSLGGLGSAGGSPQAAAQHQHQQAQLQAHHRELEVEFPSEAEAELHNFKRQACPVRCGVAGQYCCSTGQVCITNSASIAFCEPATAVITTAAGRTPSEDPGPLFTIQTQTSLLTSVPGRCGVPCRQYCCGEREVCVSASTVPGEGKGGVAYCGAMSTVMAVNGTSAGAVTSMSSLTTTKGSSGASTTAVSSGASTSSTSSHASSTSSIIQPVTGIATSPQRNDRLVVGVLALLAAILMAAIL